MEFSLIHIDVSYNVYHPSFLGRVRRSVGAGGAGRKKRGRAERTVNRITRSNNFI